MKAPTPPYCVQEGHSQASCHVHECDGEEASKNELGTMVQAHQGDELVGGDAPMPEGSARLSS
eukprot:566150-Ditylum_brightwellii.AAC.1